MCGVQDSILQRAVHVIEAQQSHMPVQGLKLPLLEERLCRDKALVQRLAAVDFADQRQVWKLLQDAAEADA